MKWTIGTKIGLGYALAMVILVVVGAISYRGTARNVENAGWVTHTHEALENLEQIYSLMIDAQRGERGYALTGEEKFS